MAQKKDKRKNNDLQNITDKTKDRVTWTPLKYNTYSYNKQLLLRDNMPHYCRISFSIYDTTWL